MATANSKAATTATDPGVVGQTYEHRKTHKVGVLESRETKYKTLLMRDREGHTFNVMYSTFRSDWRKYTGDDVIQTSSQVTEAETKVEQKEQKASETVKKVAEKAEITKVDKAEIEKITEEAKNLVDAALTKAKKEYIAKIGGRGGKMNCVRVKNGKKNLFEIWVQGDTFQLFTSADVFKALDFPEKFGEVKPEVHPKFNLTHEVVFNIKALQAVIKVAVAAI